MATDDMELVRQYAAHQSESAFATLVSRHASLVYSVALRQVRDPHLAEEITQAVFIILARKAGSLGEKTILPGWLYCTACFVSGSALKQECRRQQREQEAYMQSTLDEAGTDAVWKQMSPLLEEAMLRLGQTDRDALVLRFFEGRSLNEVGAALGASEDAAKKRVNRALEKLRKFFSKRGIASTTAIFTGAISANSVQAAPVELVKNNFCRCDHQGRNGFQFNINPHQRSSENYGMVKGKNSNRSRRRGHFSDWHNNSRGETSALSANEPVPQNSPASAKYATPEATFQSWRLAMSQGDLKGFLASLPPEGQSNYMETAGQGKSESELVAMNMKFAAMMDDFQVVSNQVVAPDEAILHFHSSRLGNASVPMKKIQGEWKISGNLTTGSDDRGH